MDTGTVVSLLFTRVTDLCLAVTVILARLGLLLLRKIDVGGVRRVMTFPSGLLFGKLDLKLFVGFGLGLGFAVLVGRGEDAERDGDAGFKVQIDGLRRARESSHTTFQSARDERKTKRILWLLFLKKQK